MVVRYSTLNSTPYGSPMGPSYTTPSPYLPRSRGTISASTTTKTTTTVTGVTHPSQVHDFMHNVEQNLRIACLDVVAAWQNRSESIEEEALEDPALAMVGPIRSQVEEQWEWIRALAEDRSTNAKDRVRLRNVATRLQFERDAWMLMERVYGPRSRTKPPRDLMGTLAGLNDVPEVELEHLPNLKRCRVLLEWLEGTDAANLSAEGGAAVAPVDDPAYRWAYTAEKASLGGQGAMDMDQPLRAVGPRSNGVRLGNVEEQAELRITYAIYRYIRVGRLDEAQKISRQVDQYWRAASIGGATSIFEFSSDGIRGGARRTWRNVAKTIASSRGVPMTNYERAVYGVFSGVLDPILSVCSTYEDRVWARMSVLVDRKIEEIADAVSMEELLTSVKDITEEEISEVMVAAASQESESNGDANVPVQGDLHCMARRAVMLIGLGNILESKNFAFLIDCLERLVDSEPAQEKKNRDLWSSRFAAHLALFLKYWNSFSKSPRDSPELLRIVKKYSLHLVSLNRAIERVSGDPFVVQPLYYQMIARYTAEINDPDLVEVFTACMKEALYQDVSLSTRLGKKVDARRSLCLRIAGDSFADKGPELLHSVTNAAVAMIWKECFEDKDLPSAGVITDAITEEDQAIIDATDFLLYPGYPSCRDALHFCTRAARMFSLHGRVSSLRGLLETVESSDALSDFIPSNELLNYRHELDGWQVYVKAVMKWHSWNQCYLSERPPPPSKREIQDATAPAGSVPYEVQASATVAINLYKKRMEAYDAEVTRLRDEAVQAILDALRFEGGWMRDVEESIANESEQKRREELVQVRQSGIPILVALLTSIYTQSGMHAQVLETATLVANEKLQLYREFSPQDLESFLRQVSESTIGYIQGRINQEGLTRPYRNQLFEESEPR